MKMRMITLGFFMVSCVNARSLEVPDWVNNVDCIIAGVQGIEEMLLDDARLYQHWNKSLEGMFCDFERREADRTKLFCVVREKVSLLQSQIALSESDKASKLEESEATIQELQSTIATIREDAQEEVARLNALVETLNQQIKEAREAYATLVNLDGQKAEALISELTAIKQAYTGMIDERTTFIATLDRFVKRTRAFMAKSGTDMNTLGVELIGQSYHDAEPVADQPATTPDEDEINESELACMKS